MSHPLLTAPIGWSLLRLAGPTTGLMLVQMLVAAVDVCFIGRLGIDALAAIALVFPFQMLMMNIAMGGMGGSIAASMARALGAGRLDDARGLVVHALVLAVASGLVFTGFAWSMAPGLYALMGGTGGALEAAVAYSHVWFAGAVLLWLFPFLSSLLRGGGDAATPGLYGLASSIVYVPLAGILALGIGPRPGLGLVGLAIVRAGICRRPPAAPLVLRDIARRPAELADDAHRQCHGHGDGGPGRPLRCRRAARLRNRRAPGFMVAPIAFGIGTGLTTLVGVAAGAGAWRRAIRAAWTGGLSRQLPSGWPSMAA